MPSYRDAGIKNYTQLSGCLDKKITPSYQDAGIKIKQLSQVIFYSKGETLMFPALIIYSIRNEDASLTLELANILKRKFAENPRKPRTW